MKCIVTVKLLVDTDKGVSVDALKRDIANVMPQELWIKSIEVDKVCGG